MKSILISVLMLSMTLLFVSCENEVQPTQNTSDMEKQLLSKKPKPNNNPKSELITFTAGHLEGFPETQLVFGCCPNAGPWPAYTMTLSGPFPPDISGTPITGNIFMNSTGRQSPGDYIVQFWWGVEPTNYFIEIRGGEAINDRRNKILTVTFEGAQCEIFFNNESTVTVPVSFTLTRAKP